MTTTFQGALQTADYNKLRGTNANGGNPWYGNQFITLCKNTVVFAARVVSAPTNVLSVASFGYNNVSVGAYTDVEVGETILISHTNNIRDAYWRGRIRKAPISGTIYINETSVNIFGNDYFWVVYDFDIWDMLSRMVGNTQYIDYDVAYQKLPPVSVGLQTAYVAWNPDDSVYHIDFDVSTSYATDIYSTPSLTFQFTFVAGTYTVTSGALNTAVVGVDFDANTEQWGKLVITDSQGTTWTRRFYIRVHGSTDTPALDFTGAQITGSIENGWNATVSAWSGVSSVLAQTFCVIWSQEYYNGTLGPLSIADNIDMVGRFHREENHGAGDPLYSYVTDVKFDVEGVATQLARLEMQDLTTIDKGTATKWDEISFNTPQRSIVYYWARHCTVLTLCDLRFPNGFDLTYLFQYVTNQGGNCYDAIKGIAQQINANVEFAPDGRIQIVRDTRYLSDKSGVVVVGNFTTADFTANDPLSQDAVQKTGKVDADGISYNSGVSNPFLSRAPGNAQGYAGGSASLPAQILAATSNTISAQAELNYRAGQLFAIENLTYSLNWKSTHGGYHFLIPSRGQRVTHTLGTGTNARGLSFDTSDYWQVVSISITHDNATGAREVTTQEELEPPVGDSGDTVPMIAGGTQNNEIVLQPTDPFANLPDDPGTYLADDPLPPPYPPLIPPKTGDTAIYTDGALVDTSRSVVARRTPVWTGATPTDLGSFEVKDVTFDRTTVAPPIGAYVLASDGTDSAIWYTVDAFAMPVVWTEGATFSGEYTQIRSAGTAGSVLVYAPGTPAPALTTNFKTSNGGYATITDATTTPNTHGQWTSGVGWECTASTVIATGSKVNSVDIDLTFTAQSVASIRMTYNITAGTFAGAGTANNYIRLLHLGAQVAYTEIDSSAVSGTNLTLTLPANVTADEIQIGIRSAFYAGGGTDGSGEITGIAVLEGNADVRYSNDYGATVGSAVTVGASPGALSGFDLERTGGASLAAESGQVKIATTLGGSYSNAAGGTLSAGQPVTLVIPYRRWDHGATQYGASDPDYLLMGDTLISSASCWKVNGATGAKTDITPVASAVGVGPNLATVYQTASTCYILLCVSVSGVRKVYRSLDGGSTWSLSKTVISPVYLRYRRSAPGVLYLLDGATLYISLNHGATWLTDSLPSSLTAVAMDMY